MKQNQDEPPSPQPEGDEVERLRLAIFPHLQRRAQTLSTSARIARAALASLPARDEIREAVEQTARECIRICRLQGENLEEGPVDATGWPTTPDGAARHQSFALADLIEESLQHERIAALKSPSPPTMGERG